MGTADKEVAGTQRTDDFRRARDERNHAFRMSISRLVRMLLPGNDVNPTQTATADTDRANTLADRCHCRGYTSGSSRSASSRLFTSCAMNVKSRVSIVSLGR